MESSTSTTTVAAKSGINSLTSPAALDSFSMDEIKTAWGSLQEQLITSMNALKQSRSELDEEREYATRLLEALLIEHFRVKRLLQTLQDLHSRETAERIFKEIAPDVQWYIQESADNIDNTPDIEVIIRQFEAQLKS